MIRPAVLLLCFAASAVTAGPVVKDGELCYACSEAVKFLEAGVTDKMLHAKTSSHMEAVCSLMTPERSEVCREVVSGLTQETLSWLLADMKPMDLCVAMTACPADTDVRTQHAAKVPNVRGVAEDQCELCEQLVEIIDNLIVDSKITPEKANATVFAFCDTLPTKLKRTCTTFAPLLVDVLLKGVDPAGACTNLGLCLEAPVATRDIQLPVNVNGMQDTPACELCELVVQFVDQYLQENSSAAAINSTVYKLCDVFPDQYKNMCLAFAPNIVKAIEQGMDPKKACTTIKLCTSAEITSVQRAHTFQDTPPCELCELVVQFVDQYLQENSSAAAINSTVYKLCDVLPDQYKNMCLSFAPNIVKAIEQGVDPKNACTTIKLCTSAETRFVQRALHVQDTVECELCELVVQYLDQYLQENSSAAVINSTVYALCEALPAELKSTCLGFAPKVVGIIEQGLDPQKACTIIKLCTSADKRFVQREDNVKDTPACELCELVVQYIDQYLQENSTAAVINSTVYSLCGALPAELKSTCLSFAPLVVKAIEQGVDPKQACAAIKLCTSADMKFVQRADNVKDTPACELCELVVQYIDQYLQENSTAAVINSTVYELCEALPAELKSTCLSFAPQVVTVIEQGVDPKQACTAIKLCTSADNRFVQATDNLQVPTKTLACELCEILVQSIDDFLKVNQTEAAINATIYKFCGDLPSTLKTTCQAFAPEIVRALEQGVEPKKACTFIKLCTAAEHALIPKGLEPEDPPDGIVCELCKLLIKTIDVLLNETVPLPAINSSLYAFCNAMPETLKLECLKLVPELVNVISRGLDPRLACNIMRACFGEGITHPEKKEDNPAPQETKLMSQVLLDRGAPVEEDEWCTFCKIFFTNVDKEALKEEKPLLHMLEDICHRLPPPTDQACLKAVDTDFPAAFEKFLNGTLSPDNVCKLITLCK